MKEVWKSIDGYEGYYEVSCFGNIRGVDRIVKYKDGGDRLYKGKDLKLEITKDNYKRVVLMKYGNKKRFMVHRIIAEAFIENIERKPFINHIDGNKSNNIYTNLEWCTASENMLHADKIGLRDMSTHHPSNSKKVKCIELNIIFDSIGKATKFLGKTKNSCSSITRAIKNNRKYCEYTWEFLD